MGRASDEYKRRLERAAEVRSVRASGGSAAEAQAAAAE